MFEKLARAIPHTYAAKWAATCPACCGEDTLEIHLAVPQSIVKQR